MENVVAYYIDDENQLHEITNSVYEKEAGMLSLITDHFSKFAVGYKEDVDPGIPATSFTDVLNHWAKNDIEL